MFPPHMPEIMLLKAWLEATSSAPLLMDSYSVSWGFVTGGMGKVLLRRLP